MALSKIDVANMVTGAVPVANGGTALTSGFVNGSDPRPTSKPIIYNGDMGVAQRGTSFTGVSSGSNWPVDRFEFYPTNLGAYTIIQEALTSGEAYNNGFRTALRIDTTTADASPASTDYAILRAKLEGKDLGLFKKGTSNAEKFTLAFWVKSNKTVTYCIVVRKFGTKIVDSSTICHIYITDIKYYISTIINGSLWKLTRF